MTNEFDPTATGGFPPDSPEAYQAEEARLETERREQEQRNIDAGLNADGTPKDEPVVVTPPTVPAQPVVPEKVDLVQARAEQIPFVKDAPLGELSLSEEQIVMKKKLAGEQKFSFYLPLDPGEKKGAVRPVIINGYRCEVTKGMQVQLPYSIYQLLVQAYDAEVSVLSDHESNLSNAGAEKRKALGLD